MYADSWSGVGRWLAGWRSRCMHGRPLSCPVLCIVSSQSAHPQSAGWLAGLLLPPPAPNFFYRRLRPPRSLTPLRSSRSTALASSSIHIPRTEQLPCDQLDNRR